jgi:hypothetical protein
MYRVSLLKSPTVGRMHVQGIAKSASEFLFFFFFPFPVGQLGHDIVGANAAEGVRYCHLLRGPGPAAVLE